MAAGADQPQVIQVIADHDIVSARNAARQVAATLAFTPAERTLITTAISEIARNIAIYASPGKLTVATIERHGRWGIQIIARDNGPGIPDLELAMTDGWSTGNSLGMGLPSARRLMDEFEIESGPGIGTTVTMIKWER